MGVDVCSCKDLSHLMMGGRGWNNMGVDVWARAGGTSGGKGVSIVQAHPLCPTTAAMCATLLQ